MRRADTDTDEMVPTGPRETSVLSAEVLNEKAKNKWREKIYAEICHRGAMTCDEVEVVLGIRHQTASCFIRFLTQDSFLRPKVLPNGEIEKRVTRAGRKAIVWEPIPKADRLKKTEKDLFSC